MSTTAQQIVRRAQLYGMLTHLLLQVSLYRRVQICKAMSALKILRAAYVL